MAIFDAKGSREHRLRRHAHRNCLTELRNLRMRLRGEAPTLTTEERTQLQEEIVALVRDLTPGPSTAS